MKLPLWICCVSILMLAPLFLSIGSHVATIHDSCRDLVVLLVLPAVVRHACATSPTTMATNTERYVGHVVLLDFPPTWLPGVLHHLDRVSIISFCCMLVRWRRWGLFPMIVCHTLTPCGTLSCPMYILYCSPSVVFTCSTFSLVSPCA